MSTSGVVSSRPIPVERRRKVIAPPVAIIVFDGMQSRRWAAPPIRSRSTIVTSAPYRAAYVAALLPAGPPPMISRCVAIAVERKAPSADTRRRRIGGPGCDAQPVPSDDDDGA